MRTGLWGEKLAERMLKNKGYRILGKRVRVGRRGELDIVARSGNVLVFIEVKTRSSERYGRAMKSVNTSKKRILARAAMRYMSQLKERPQYFRFDVVEVIGRYGEGIPIVRHIENAFSLPSPYRVRW